MSDWQPISSVAALLQTAVTAPPPPADNMQIHEIDYEIFGHKMQFVEIELDPG